MKWEENESRAEKTTDERVALPFPSMLVAAATSIDGTAGWGIRGGGAGGVDEEAGADRAGIGLRGEGSPRLPGEPADREAWQAQIGGAIPVSADRGEGALLLTPKDHGTDGFFIAIFQRKVEP